MNLPYIVDGDVVVSQSNACLVYLGEKFGLLGATPRERIECEQLLCEVMDLRNAMVKEFYGAGDLQQLLAKGGDGKLAHLQMLGKLDAWIAAKRARASSSARRRPRRACANCSTSAQSGRGRRRRAPARRVSVPARPPRALLRAREDAALPALAPRRVPHQQQDGQVRRDAERRRVDEGAGAGLVRRHGSRAARNAAFVFVKPHANAESVVALVRATSPGAA